MTEQAPHEILQRLLRDSGLGWLLDGNAPPEQSLRFFVERLDRVAIEFRDRIGAAVRFDPQALQAEAASNPHKIKAFLQALGAGCTPPMMVMVWRILQGLEIRDVSMAYHARQDFRLAVRLLRPDDGRGAVEEKYESADMSDAALLRHFGITTIGAKPLFDGFYPLRLRN